MDNPEYEARKTYKIKDRKVELLAVYSKPTYLDEGAFGAVYKTTHKQEKRDYAVKFQSVKKLFEGEDSSSLVQLLRETHFMRQFRKHPNIVGLANAFFNGVRGHYKFSN